MTKSTKQKNQQQLLFQQKADLAKMSKELPMELVRASEDRLLKQCFDIMEGTLDFAALGYTDGQIDESGLPAAWTFLSPEEKARKIRLAQYGCLPSGDVPYGVKAAFSTAVGIIKARATENSGTKVLNLEVSTFPAPSPVTQDPNAIDTDFEVIDIE